MDYLSKKVITDQTEKLALARISSKMEISTQEVEAGINRLSTKNLIRKIYVQGKVGFELTPKGEAAIKVIANAETERITKQLQEAIHVERKAKLRSSTVNKMKSIEDKWQKIQLPDIKTLDTLVQEATIFLSMKKEIENKQPFCYIDLKNYEQEFSQYKNEIENMIQQNNNLIKAVDNYARIKNYQISISTDIENINKTINKYVTMPEAATQVSQLKISLSKLKAIQSQLESFDESQLSEFEELKIRLRDNSRLLEILKKPTHEFTPIKKENIAENTTWYSDTEGPIKDGLKTSGYTLVEKCSKCGTKRRSTPVNIG